MKHTPDVGINSRLETEGKKNSKFENKAIKAKENEMQAKEKWEREKSVWSFLIHKNNVNMI